MRRQAGLTYLGALVLVALISAMLASAAIIWHTASQREKELELLFVGNQFRSAIRAYYEQGSGADKHYPRTLDDLLLDNRNAVSRRHLRKIFVDPMTASTRWGLLMAEQGGIRGVHSLSEAQAVKTGNFATQDRAFEGKTRVTQWLFTHP